MQTRPVNTRCVELAINGFGESRVESGIGRLEPGAGRGQLSWNRRSADTSSEIPLDGGPMMHHRESGREVAYVRRMHKKKWDDLSDRQQTALLVAASVNLALTATALVHLACRPRELVRGSKALWLLGCLVQPVGPIAYLTIGARRS